VGLPKQGGCGTGKDDMGAISPQLNRIAAQAGQRPRPVQECAAWKFHGVLLKCAYFGLFHTTSAVVPIDPAGLYHFSSSSESDVIIRLLSMPSKFGYELPSI